MKRHKPTGKQLATYAAWFERLIHDMQTEPQTEEITIAIANVGKLQIQLTITRDEFNKIDKVQTIEDADL